MTHLRWLCVTLATVAPSGVVSAQLAPPPVGTAALAGVEIGYRCIPAPPGAQRFYVEATIANSDFLQPPDLPATTLSFPGLTAGISAISRGSGTGEPLGDFSFTARWFGFQPGTVIAAIQDVFGTPDGDLYADEIFTGVGPAPPPNGTMHGAFTFTGGTGQYEGAFGAAAGFAQQLGDGIHTAFVACGWIGGS